MAKKRNVSTKRPASSKKPRRDEDGNPTNTKEVYQDANSAGRAVKNKSSIFYPSGQYPVKVRNIPGFNKANMQGFKDAQNSSSSRYSRLTGAAAPGQGMGGRGQGSRGGGGFLSRGK